VGGQGVWVRCEARDKRVCLMLGARARVCQKVGRMAQPRIPDFTTSTPNSPASWPEQQNPKPQQKFTCKLVKGIQLGFHEGEEEGAVDGRGVHVAACKWFEIVKGKKNERGARKVIRGGGGGGGRGEGGAKGDTNRPINSKLTNLTVNSQI